MRFGGDRQASAEGIQRPFAKDAIQHIHDGIAAGSARTQKQDAGMGARWKTADIRKIEIERDEEPVFFAHTLPDLFIGGAGKPLVVYSIDVVSCVAQPFDVRAPQVFVHLDRKGAHRSGTISSSRASMAA